MHKKNKQLSAIKRVYIGLDAMRIVIRRVRSPHVVFVKRAFTQILIFEIFSMMIFFFFLICIRIKLITRSISEITYNI